MTRTETCLEAAVRMAAGVAIVAVGHAAGSLAAELFGVIGPLVYLLGAGPALVVGLYAVATALWVVAESASARAVERALERGDVAGVAGPATGTDGAAAAPPADDSAGEDG